MFASNAFVRSFSLFCFFISSFMAQRDTCKAKNTFPLIFSRTPINDTMSTYPGLFTGVFAPSDLLGLTAKTLISDCVHGQLICFPSLFLAVWMPRYTNA